MIDITIKYLPEIFPLLDFTQNFIVSQEIVKLQTLPQIARTSDLWRSVFDSSNINRNVQCIIEERYKFEFFIKEYSEPPAIMAADFITIYTTDGKQIAAHNVTVDYTQINNLRIYKVVIQFSAKLKNNISHYIAHSVCKELQATNLMNYLEFTIEKPPYQQFTYLNYLYSSDIAAYVYQFEFNINEATENIQLNDWFYLHSNIDHLNENIDFFVGAKCINKTSSKLTFRVNESGLNIGQLYGQITLDYEPEQNELDSVTPRALTLCLYTSLMPKFIIENEKGERIEQQDGINYDDRSKLYDLLNILFYVKNENLYLIKYFNCIEEYKPENITFFLRSTPSTYLQYKAVQVADMYENNEREDLNELQEINFNIRINNLVVSSFR